MGCHFQGSHTGTFPRHCGEPRGRPDPRAPGFIFVTKLSSSPQPVPRLGAGHECQRQAPARWPATLQPRWGAPGEDLATAPAGAASAGLLPGPAGHDDVARLHRRTAQETPMTTPALVLRDPPDPRRPGARQRHRRPGAADLPDDVLRLQRHRARREPVRAQGVRQHLHPDHEPDPGRRGAADRGARGRRRGAARVAPARPPRPSRSSTSPRPATTSSPAPASTAAPSTC